MTIADDMQRTATNALRDMEADLAAASTPVSTTPSTALPKVGPQPRPNGQIYHPRRLQFSADDSTVVEDLAFLHDARTHQEHVLLDGPPGSGKTAVVEAAFPDLETLVGSASTTEADLVGTFVQDPDSGQFVWVDGPLTRSVRNGVPLLLDEVALIDPRELTVLYPLMDGRPALSIQMNPSLRPIPVPDSWFVVGAFNPNVPGADMSDALLSRFTHHVHVSTDWTLARELGVSEDLITVAQNLTTKALKGTYDGWIPQMREALDFMAAETRLGTAFAVSVLLRKCPQQDREVVAEALAKRFGNVQPLALGARIPQRRR